MRFRDTIRLAIPSIFATCVATLAWGQESPQTSWILVGWNNLGMHCMDSDFSTFTILPPFNTIHAQLIDPSGALVTIPAAGGITVTYQAVADSSGSINRTSAGKTNFWEFVTSIFGADLAIDTGLAGNAMPGIANAPQPMSFDVASGWFVAAGIPITPLDDAHVKNPYPLMHLVARNASGTILATTDIVLPVSDEMDCRGCHASGSGPAARPVVGWSWNADGVLDYRRNILLLHDDRQRTDPTYVAALAATGYSASGLYPTAVSGKPILCAACHASEALAAGGQPGVSALTRVMHDYHGEVVDPTNGLLLDSSSNRSACYRCHPGSTTKCLRGAMGTAVAADGSMAMQCQSCHGTMKVVGAATRAGWIEEPVCQSCHTGTAVANNGQIRYANAFDAPGHARVAVNRTFATNADVPAAGLSLYRFSMGHGALACEACHGSTHAEYPSSHANDNVQSQNLQGHSGVLVECESCHGVAPGVENLGPHGMHPVGQQWVIDHHDRTPDPSLCRPCHGTDYRGTVLSASQADRTLSTEFGTKSFWNGYRVGCYACHLGPFEGDRNPNHPPVASNAAGSTTAGDATSIDLVATDADHNPLALRIVSQPAHGTAALVGAVAVYFPEASWVGIDAFTFAASDGSSDSNQATVSIDVGVAPCTMTCAGLAPSSTPVGVATGFSGTATHAGCTAPVTFEWDFGDGAPRSAVQSPTHTFAAIDTFRWTFTASSGGMSCTDAGLVKAKGGPLRVPYLLQPVRVSTPDRGRTLTLDWDSSNCPSIGYHVLYGFRAGLPAFTIAGAACAIGDAGSALWTNTPDASASASGLVWFVVVGDDGGATEGSWGLTSAGLERGGPAASGWCGMAGKDTAGFCAAP